MRRKPVLGFVLVGLLGTCCLGDSPVYGQQRRGAGLGRERMTLMGLLERESIQQELAITETQLDSIQQLASKQRENRTGLRKLNPDERLAKIQERIEADQAALAETLDDAQLKRLIQISYQVRGVIAFADSSVIETLSLTEDQQKQLRSLVSEAAQARLTFDPEQAAASRRKIETARQSAIKKAVALLTPTQAAQWREMLGKPLEDQENE